MFLLMILGDCRVVFDKKKINKKTRTYTPCLIFRFSCVRMLFNFASHSKIYRKLKKERKYMLAWLERFVQLNLNTGQMSHVQVWEINNIFICINMGMWDRKLLLKIRLSVFLKKNNKKTHGLIFFYFFLIFRFNPDFIYPLHIFLHLPTCSQPATKFSWKSV